MKTFVIFGRTGEYSDYDEWPIIAVASEGRAQELVLKLDTLARENGIANGCTVEPGAIEALNSFLIGSVTHVSYTGVDFYYAEVPLEELP